MPVRSADSLRLELPTKARRPRLDYPRLRVARFSDAAKPGDYRKAVQRIYHAPGLASFVELPLVTTP